MTCFDESDAGPDNPPPQVDYSGGGVQSDYLGDGVYIEFDGYQYKLFTSNGLTTTNEVFLDDYALKNFEAFLKRIKK